LGLSVSEKASSVRPSFGPPLVVRIGSKKAPTTPSEKDVSGYRSTHVVNLVDTSTSKDEAM
jgi:hypothetical protein